MTDVDRALEASILALLAERESGKTICVSEAARDVHADVDDPEGWRELMEPAREAARRANTAPSRSCHTGPNRLTDAVYGLYLALCSARHSRLAIALPARRLDPRAM